jgi:hypothetical protein
LGGKQDVAIRNKKLTGEESACKAKNASFAQISLFNDNSDRNWARISRKNSSSVGDYLGLLPFHAEPKASCCLARCGERRRRKAPIFLLDNSLPARVNGR